LLALVFRLLSERGRLRPAAAGGRPGDRAGASPGTAV